MSGLNSDSLVGLSELRALTQVFFEEQKITAKQIITVDTESTSSRLLSFQYYNSSELGSDLATLNEEINVNNLNGTVQIFTE